MALDGLAHPQTLQTSFSPFSDLHDLLVPPSEKKVLHIAVTYTSLKALVLLVGFLLLLRPQLL